MDDKFITIETTLAHHDQQIAELSEVITDQWKQIESLKNALARLGEKVGQMEYDRAQEDSSKSSIDKAREEIPPHY